MGSFHWNERSQRYFISVYWQKKQYTIWRYTGRPMRHEDDAKEALYLINAEVKNGEFNPKAWQPDSPLSIKQYSVEFLKASTACTNTKRVYRSDLRAAVTCVDKDGKLILGPDTDIRHISHSKLLQLYNCLKLSVKGKKNCLSTLKTMLRMAYADELIKKVPPFPKLPDGLPDKIDYLSLEQQELVLAQIPEIHRPIFIVGMEYGLRIGELRAVKKDSIVDGELIIRRSFSDNRLTETTKTKTIRVYGITERARQALDMAYRQSPFAAFAFAKNRRGTPYRGEDLNRIWKVACEKVGISIKLNNGIRHSRAGTLLDKGYGYEIAADVLGHSSVQVTRTRYCHRQKASITAILEGMGNVVEFKVKDATGSNDNQGSE